MAMNVDFTPRFSKDRGGVWREGTVEDTVDGVFVFLDNIGQKVVLHESNREPYYARFAGCYGGTDKSTQFQAVCSHADVKEIIIDSEFDIDGTVTIGYTKTLSFQGKGKLHVGATGTLQIEGMINACKQQIFSWDSGSVIKIVPDKTDTFYPEWFGAVTSVVTGTGTDSHAAFQKLADSMWQTTALQRRCSYKVDLSGIYALSDTWFLRNVSPIISGKGQAYAAANGCGFRIHGAHSILDTTTSYTLATGEYLPYNSHSICEPPVGELRVTLSGVTNGTEIYLYIGTKKTTTACQETVVIPFTYSGASTLVKRNFRPNMYSVYHFTANSTTYVEAETFINSNAGTINIPKVAVSNNIGSGVTVDQIAVQGLNMLSVAVSNGTSTQVDIPLYGPTPPYEVKVTMTGVSIGTALQAQVFRNGAVVPAYTTNFTYNGSDTVAIAAFTPILLDSTNHPNIYSGNEWVCISLQSSPATAPTFANKWVRYGTPTTLINNVASSTITSFKFDATEMLTPYKWQGKSLIDMSGCDNIQFRDFAIWGKPSLNPLKVPYAAFHAWRDMTNTITEFTQREHTYHNINITYTNDLAGFSYLQFRCFYAGFAIDGPFSNNDFFIYEHCRAYSCKYGYYNMCNQAVEHSLNECHFGASDWAMGVNGVTVQLYKPFIEFAIGQGFMDLNTTSSWRTVVNCEGFTTEGIEGLYFLRSLNAPNVLLQFKNTQPVFWNQLTTADIDPYLIAMNDARGLILFDGGDWFISNVGGGPRNVKIRMGNNSGRTLSTLVCRNMFTTSNQIGTVKFENRNRFNFEGNANHASNTSASNGSLYRATIKANGDQWTAYLASGSGANNLMSLSFLVNNPTPTGNPDILTWCANTDWFDIGDMGRGPTLGLNVDSKRFVPSPTTTGPYTIANYFPGNTMILGVSFYKWVNSGIFEGASATSFEQNYSRLYIGDVYDWDRWGYLQFYTSGNRNTKPSATVVYDAAASLVLTPVYAPPAASISGSTLTGSGFVTSLSASLAGRTCRIISGAFAGVEFTIVSVNSTTQMTITPPAETVTGSFDWVIMGKLVAPTGSNSYGVVSLCTSVPGRFAAGGNATDSLNYMENLT